MSPNLPIASDLDIARTAKLKPITDLAREAGRIAFLEVNLQANLWSAKVYGRSAALAGLSQAELVETILAESLRRHGLIAASRAESWRHAG